MKKYLKLIIPVLVILGVLALIFFKSSKLETIITNTINTKDKINYSTSVTLDINDSYNSSKVQYDCIKSYNIRKVEIKNYIGESERNSISKYEVKEKNKTVTYVYNGEDYEKIEKASEDLEIDYKALKNKMKNVKRIKKDEYSVKMKGYEAFNLLYSAEIMTKKDFNNNVTLHIKTDNKNKFIKEISYEIENLNKSEDKNSSIKYKVKILNTDINNKNKIELPFKKK